MEPPDSPRLLDRVRDKIRLKHYSIRTEHAYVEWIKRFIRFHGKRHPADLGPVEVEAFLSNLAVARHVAASTQNQAKSALLFLYKEVMGVELPWLDQIDKAKVPARLPVVLTRDEVAQVLEKLRGVHALIGCLLYGSGMRVMEGLRLRVKDIDFARHEILVRDGKGMKDRVTMLPHSVVPQLRTQIESRALCITTMSSWDSVRYGCHTHSLGSIRRQRESGLGNMFFPLKIVRVIRAAVMSGVITCRTRRFSARCGKRCAMRIWPSPQHRTRFAIPSRRTSSRLATTFAPCRNYLATRTSARP